MKDSIHCHCRRFLIVPVLLILWFFPISSRAETESEESLAEVQVVKPKPVKKAAPNAIHPNIGEKKTFGDMTLTLHSKLQNYTGGTNPPRDPDILSPKSVNIHPDGQRFYVNSLEGGRTIVYSLPDLKKLAVISHKFTEKDSSLWASPSGLFKFRHYDKTLGTFMGKPVESVFSHGGRYLWVPYYRRSFDLNAQDPSAVSIIDTESNQIIRIMEAGVLPKMIAVSPDGSTLAISHWGDNTVGLIDIASDDPGDWKYVANVAVGKQLFHNFSLTSPVDRDSNTGEALRGTVFTPDGHYLLVGCMGGGGIAVIDVRNRKYLGKLVGTRPNLRHLVVKNGYLYASINASGYVERIPMSEVMSAINKLDGKENICLKGIVATKVASGARTLELSPQGDYIFVACNSGSAICVVDSSMNLVGEIQADSFPVGLAVSPDGKWIITTSQGRVGAMGGNCVDVFSVDGLSGKISDEITRNSRETVDKESTAMDKATLSSDSARGNNHIHKWLYGAAGGGMVLTAILIALYINRKKNTESKNKPRTKVPD